jgi:3-deoxy-D-manno-octulosonate 8-phosphate phosphatase (KDO 8-P phosphatase)
MDLIKDFANFEEVKKAFTSIGGKFILPAETIKSKLPDIKAFVFDWDGVFNDGFKGEGSPSLFSEIDSAGLNLLRYGYYRLNKTIPLSVIITGEENPAALHFAKRENFNQVFLKVLNKADAINHLCKRSNITPAQVACVFDDINDLSMAQICGLRFMINKTSNPALQSAAVKNNWCDYITGNEQPKYPLREICELIMSFTGKFEESLLSRVNLDDTYKKFLEQKKSTVPHFVKAANVGFQEVPA